VSNPGRPTSRPTAGSKPAATGSGAQPAPTNSAIAALLNNGVGPAGGPAAGGGSSGGGQLTSDQIEATVRTHSAGVKRSCFEKLATDKTGTVQVTVQVQIGGNGAVQSATGSGSDPMIVKCIEGAVRSWQFPASGGTTTVNIPFKFLRQ
jgi:hypothetical protein